MAERGIKWRSPGEVWRAYEAAHPEESWAPAGAHELAQAAEAEAMRAHYERSGGRDLV